MKTYKLDVLNLVNSGDSSRTIKADGFEWTEEGNRIQFYRYEEKENPQTRQKRYVASYPADKVNIKGITNYGD